MLIMQVHTVGKVPGVGEGEVQVGSCPNGSNIAEIPFRARAINPYSCQHARSAGTAGMSLGMLIQRPKTGHGVPTLTPECPENGA